MPLLSTRPESFGGNRKRHQGLWPRWSRSPTRLCSRYQPQIRAREQSRFPHPRRHQRIAAAAFGIGWTSECLRELFKQFSTDGTGFNPEVAAIVPMQAPVHVIGRDDSVAYADINVDYRSEPELFAVLLVLQRLQNATS